MSKGTVAGEADGDAWVDTHVHVFRRGLSLAPERRYQPDGEALPEVLLAEMRRAGVARSVLVQPSFLGTDNSYLLDTMARHPRLGAGIAVVDAGASPALLDELRRGGVVGVRLNCIGGKAPDLARGRHRALADRLASAGLVLQIQAEGRQWEAMAPALAGLPCRVVIDHFGRTPPGEADGFFPSLLKSASDSERVWFKFSGPYRLAGDAASRCAEQILRTIGIERIVWGSDWPWTQFEGRHSYGDTLGWLASWIPQESERRRVLEGNPRALFGLA